MISEAIANMISTYPGWTLFGIIAIGVTFAESIGKWFGGESDIERWFKRDRKEDKE